MENQKTTPKFVKTETIETISDVMSFHLETMLARPESELALEAKADLAEVLPTFLESYPLVLQNLSIKQVCFQLTDKEAKQLQDICENNFGEEHDISHTIYRDIVSRLSSIEFDNFFIRLSSRSPKDSWLGQDIGFKCQNAEQALEILTSSERIWEDLQRNTRAGHPTSLYIREWLDIPAWAEFRCVIKDKQLISISQYDYREGQQYSEIVDNYFAIQNIIENFIADEFVPACHLDNVVADIVFPNGDLRNPVLLEINPYGGKTDPCLYRDDNPIFTNHPVPKFRYHGDGFVYSFAKKDITLENLVYDVVEVEDPSEFKI